MSCFFFVPFLFVCLCQNLYEIHIKHAWTAHGAGCSRPIPKLNLISSPLELFRCDNLFFPCTVTASLHSLLTENGWTYIFTMELWLTRGSTYCIIVTWKLTAVLRSLNQGFLVVSGHWRCNRQLWPLLISFLFLLIKSKQAAVRGPTGSGRPPVTGFYWNPWVTMWYLPDFFIVNCGAQSPQLVEWY